MTELQIKQLNLAYALKLGLITWSEYLEAFRKLEE
jgi:hypothetical protein